jgi:hypothetical protein
MSSTYAEPLDLVERGLDELASIGPEFRTTGERREFLLRVARVKARVVAEELRVLAVSDDIAEETGDRSTATWLAHQTREAHGTVRRHAGLASALAARWELTADALAVGDLNLAQARVIVEALDALPEELGDDLVVKAEAYLVEQAAVFGPRELRHLGRGVLEHLAPEIADEAEYHRLVAEEQRVLAATRLELQPRGDGSTDLHARVPTTWPTDSAPTWTPTPRRAAPHWVRSTRCQSPGGVGRRSWRSWRTSPTPGCPSTAALRHR